MNLKRMIKIGIIPFLLIGSLVVGFWGYMSLYRSGAYIVDHDPFVPEKDSFWYHVEHAFFDSLGQFFFNRDKGGHMNWQITVTQFVAPLSMIGGVATLIVCFQRIMEGLRCFFRKITGGKVIAIYGDTEEKKTIVQKSDKEKKKTLIYRERALVLLADVHILFFRDDRHSIQFFEENVGFFSRRILRRKQKKVIIVLDQTDSFLFEGEGFADGKFSNVQFVNINEIIARDFWRDNVLLEYKKTERLDVHVAILGFGDLGKKLLHYGIILNCYGTNQRIKYHVWGDTTLFQQAVPKINEKINDADMNDGIVFHRDALVSAVDQLNGMDRIILTDECWAEFVQTVIRKHPNIDVYFVDPEGSSLARLRGPKVRSYAPKNSFDIDRILRETEHEAGKEVNARYAMIFGDYLSDGIQPGEKKSKTQKWKEKKWTSLNPFLVESNDLAAEYHTIRELILLDYQLEQRMYDSQYPLPENIKEFIASLVDELCILEHARWCRFHYLNGWEHESRDNMSGKRKDEIQRLHSDLVRYEKLEKTEQPKDLEIIATLLADKTMRPGNGISGIRKEIRHELIRQMAIERYGKVAEAFWRKNGETIGEVDKPVVQIKGYDIAGIAFVEVFRKKNKDMEFIRSGFDEELKVIPSTVTDSIRDPDFIICMNGADEKNYPAENRDITEKEIEDALMNHWNAGIEQQGKVWNRFIIFSIGEGEKRRIVGCRDCFPKLERLTNDECM